MVDPECKMAVDGIGAVGDIDRKSDGDESEWKSGIDGGLSASERNESKASTTSFKVSQDTWDSVCGECIPV